MTHEELVTTAPTILTVTDIATLFRQDPETVKRHARNGTLPGFKLGKAWYFRWSDMENMIKDAVSTSRKESD